MDKMIDKRKIVTWWVPALVGGLIGLFVVLLAWNIFNAQSMARFDRVRAYAEVFALDIQTDLDSRIPALQRMVSRWEFRGGTPREEFLRDAGHYIHDFGGFQAIEWVDETFHVRWVTPMLGNEGVVGLNLGFEEKRRIALERAKGGRVPVMSAPVDLIQGGKGILVYFPIYTQSEFNGFLLAVFQMDTWLNEVMRFNEEHDNLKDVRFYVEMDDQMVFKQSDWDDLPAKEFDVIASRSIMGHLFTVHSRPTEALLERTESMLPYLVGGAGLALAMLVSFTMYFFQKANAEALLTGIAKVALEREIVERTEAEDQLKLASSRLGLATKAGRIGVWDWDVESNRLSWDPLMYEIYEIPDDVIPKYETWRGSLHPEDVEDAEWLLQAALDGKAAFETEFRISTANGMRKHIQAAARVERDADGQPRRMIGVNWDITMRKTAQEALAVERQRLASIIRGTNVGTWEWNVQTGEVVFNERWANIVGYSLAELEPVSIDTWMGFAHPDDLKVSGELLEKHFSGELEYYECEARMKHRNGEWIWVLDRGKVATWTEDGKPLLMSGTHKDITEQKQAEDRIRHLATHDTLTDLPTLRLARDRIRMALATAERKQMMAAILFVDLDGFKSVNDNLGHDIGDELLKETARRLKDCVRHVDTVARIGGDEFLIVLAELRSRDNVETVAGKIVATVATPFGFEGKTASVGASVGISTCEGDCGKAEIDRLIKLADKAMYTIKKSGKNGYAFADPVVL